MSIIILTSIAVGLRIVSNPVANVFQKRLTAGGHHPLVVNFLLLALGIGTMQLPTN